MPTSQETRNARKFDRHRAADPHCTCTDCIAYHEAHTRFVAAVTVAAPPVLDVTVENHGSVFIFQPHTPAAREWIGEHVPGEATWFAGGLVVEPRYAKDLSDGMIDDGLVVR